MTTAITTPSPQTPAVTNAQADGAGSFLATGAIGGYLTLQTANVGTFGGPVRGMFFLTFEVNMPPGTLFDAVSIGLVRTAVAGSGTDVPVMAGFIENDGVWNTGGEAGTGWAEYTNIEDVPHPDTAGDSAWLGSAAVSTDNWTDVLLASGRTTFGSGFDGLTVDDPAWLTKFQQQFEDNEPYRTSRGVPVAVMFVPTGTDSRVFAVKTVNSNDIDSRPNLTFSALEVDVKLSEETDLLGGYLPSGPVFASKMNTDSNTFKLIKAFAKSFSRLSSTQELLQEEVMPDRTNLFLDEWERAVGIPDDCFAVGDTNESRRHFILMKLAHMGIQTNLDFVNLAAEVFGLVVEVESGHISWGLGNPHFFGSEKESRFTIVITFQNSSEAFPYTFPLPFGSGETAILECLYTKLKPANCNVLFLAT